MKVEILKQGYDSEKLFTVVNRWYDEAQKSKFGLNVDLVTALFDIDQLISLPDTDVLVLVDEDVFIGFMGMGSSFSKVGNQRVAEERYYYVIPEKRGISSLRLVKASENWAKEKECTHFIIYASNLASKLHDRICKLYERLGMQLFETSYIKEL